MISKLEHQHHRKYCWYPKRQLMFLFCLEQEQMLLQKDRLQEKKESEITRNFAYKKGYNYKSRYYHNYHSAISKPSTKFIKRT